MDKEQLENLDSEIEEEETETEEEDVETLKEKNKQLFARAKKAEEELKGLKPEKKSEPKPEPKPEPEGDVKQTVKQLLEERELEDLEISDTLKEKVQRYAKLENISIRKALKSDYIQFQKEAEEKKQEVESAALGNNPKASVKKDYSKMNSKDFDFTTEEGREEFKKWEEYQAKLLG